LPDGQNRAPQATSCIALVSAFGLALSWIFAFLGLTVRSAEAARVHPAVRLALPAHDVSPPRRITSIR
jgi:hypothetical protein